jgi:hypothetical protein
MEAARVSKRILAFFTRLLMIAIRDQIGHR